MQLWAANLVSLARGLVFDCGIERSFKLTPGGFDTERFLLSFATVAERAWRQEAVAGLRRLGLSAAAAKAVGAALPAAKFLHFGYEEPHGAAGLKVYLEFDPQHSDLIHRSYKWRPGTEAFAIDEYRQVTEREIPALPGAAAPFVQAGDGFAEIASHIAPEDYFRLEITRIGGGRTSFDLRLYDAEMRLADATALLAPVALFCGCGPAYAKLMRERGHETLGHVAGGLGPDDSPYLTAYYGAEALQ